MAAMKIQYLGHASFLLTTAEGTRIVTDPINREAYPDSVDYRPFNEPANIVTISHDHDDHRGVSVVLNTPVIIKGNGKFIANGAEFLGVATYHDESKGAERGRNTVFVIGADGLRVAHMGDLGHVLTSDQAAEIGAVDVALIPIGGVYTIDAAAAQKVADQVEAKIVIPMHYRTSKCRFPIAGVEDFLEGKPNVTRPGGSVLEVTRDSLPERQQIVVLEHAL